MCTICTIPLLISSVVHTSNMVPFSTVSITHHHSLSNICTSTVTVHFHNQHIWTSCKDRAFSSGGRERCKFLFFKARCQVLPHFLLLEYVHTWIPSKCYMCSICYVIGRRGAFTKFWWETILSESCITDSELESECWELGVEQGTDDRSWLLLEKELDDLDSNEGRVD